MEFSECQRVDSGTQLAAFTPCREKDRKQVRASRRNAIDPVMYRTSVPGGAFIADDRLETWTTRGWLRRCRAACGRDLKVLKGCASWKKSRKRTCCTSKSLQRGRVNFKKHTSKPSVRYKGHIRYQTHVPVTFKNIRWFNLQIEQMLVTY